jgi:hypothetical protein
MKKRNKVTKALAAFLIFASPGFASHHEVKVNITWDEPERFSDMDENNIYSPSLFRQFSSEMEKFISEKANQYLPDETTLNITVHDIDLAGEIEPWRRPNASTIRIVKDIYPPRMKFEYNILGEDGKILKQGMAQITDQLFLWNVALPGRSTDTFYYEKELMADWLRKNLENLPSV